LNDGQASTDAREVALLAAAVSGLVPAAILFAPRQDSFFPTISALVLALAHGAVSGQSSLRAAMAGMVLWLGMFISLAFAVVGLMAGLFVAQEYLMQRGKGPSFFRLWVAAVGGWFIGPLLIYAAWGANVFDIWDFNLTKNDEFYQLNVRTFHLWVWVNVVEFAVAVGLPVALFASIKAIGEGRRFTTGRHYDTLAISWLAVLGLLNFAGVSRSEVARLWLPFAPFAALFAAETLVRFDPAARRWCVAAFILLQASTCIILARHVCVMD
jgi:methylthioxylose transferase